MTNAEIKLFRVKILSGGIYWRSIDGEIYRVVGYHPDYREFDDMGEPVAVLEGNKTAALQNCELEDFVKIVPAF